MKYLLDTNVIISHFKGDKFSDDTDRFFAFAKRSGELYAKKLLKSKRSSNRILPDFIIGAHAEFYSDALVTWNPSDFDLKKDVLTPVEIMK